MSAATRWLFIGSIAAYAAALILPAMHGPGDPPDLRGWDLLSARDVYT